MPVYDFQHARSGEIISVYVSAKAPAIERKQQKRGRKVFKRVWTAPLAAQNMGVKLGDGTKEDFSRVTTGKKGIKVGDLWEVSKEMSEKRAQRHGKDPVQEAQYAQYEKETGEKHPDAVKRDRIAAANAKLADMGIHVNM